MTIFSPQIGAVVTTHRGNSGIVERLENKRVIVRVADGILKSIPLVAIAHWHPPPPDQPITREPTIGKGSTVGKAHNLGWLGWVQTEPIDGWCDVLWQYDKHPTLEKLTSLKLKEI